MSSASPANSAVAARAPRKRLFELAPVAPEADFAIALNAESSGPVGAKKLGSFACMNAQAPNCVGAYEYLEGGRHFNLAENDFKDESGVSTGDRSGHRHPTKLVDKRGAPTCEGRACQAEASGHSFLFEGFDQSKHARVERLELQVSQSGGSQSDILQFGEWRYLRYFIKIHPKFGLSAEDVLITQVWQRDSGQLLDPSGTTVERAAVGPAFSVSLTAAAELPPDPRCSVPAGTGTINALFSYRNDSNSEWAAERAGGRIRVPILTCTLPKDTWLGFAIAMQPMHEPLESTDPKKRGTILIWKLDTRTGLSFGPDLPVASAANFDANDDSKYRFYWGFRPERRFTSPPDPLGGFTDRFDIRIGIYRASPLYSTLWFDDIKLTNNEACLPGRDATCPSHQ